jgi:hypothetical protein
MGQKNQDQVLDVIMKEMKPITPPMARESFGQVMRVITKDGFAKPDSIQVLIDLVRENTKVTRPVPVKAQRELGLR